MDETAINDIIDFANAVRKKGGIVVVTYPNILKNCLDIEKNAIFLRELKKRLEKNDIMVIGDPIAATFDIESVFDSPNHQNEIGQILSTERLIRDLDSNKILQRLQ